ncbi:MAG: lipoyl(octanoyl) transferase LipB [Planctomycetota bacterium]
MSTPPIQTESGFDLRVQDLGRAPYPAALALQRRLQQEVIDARGRDGRARTGHLLLLEHDPPVITVSRRKTARRHLVASPEQLAAAGVEVAETDRGGDITYHGPGQLVAYLILDLNTLGLRLHGYMRWLEDVVTGTLGRFGIEGHRDPEATGVWVGMGRHEGAEARRHEGGERHEGTEALRHEGVCDPVPHPASRTPHTPPRIPHSSKICAMGVRVSRWVSMHGLALNVTTDLSHFDLIVPCGLAGRRVTSMRELLGDACPSMDDVKRAATTHVRQGIERTVPVR